MLITPAARPDWYTWRDPPLDWCQQNEPLPGLQFGLASGRIIVTFHVTHVPCMPDEAQAIVNKRRAELAYFQRDTSLLRSYQIADLDFLGPLHCALIAHEMRVGKTPIACHLHDPNSGLLVITGPLAVRESWRDWIERTFDWPLCCLSGKTNVVHQPGFPAYFCHYDILGAHSDFFQSQKIGTLVFDEVHYLQSKKAQRLQASYLISTRASKVLALSGTPVWNKPKSLYPLLHLVAPGAWGNRFQFLSRYCDPQPGAYGWSYEGATNVEELQARLQQIMVRRTWSSVAPELPPTTRVIEPVEVTGAQYAAIESSAMKVSLMTTASTEAGYTAILRRKMAEIKIKPAIEIASRAAGDGHKVVLWVWHNAIGDKLEAALPAGATFRLQSSDPVRVRDWNVDQFRAHPEPAFMVASMGVAGVGLDLSCSDYAIFVELDWTPANVYQASMRTFHISRPHALVFLYTDTPTEARLIDALDVKNNFAAALGLGSDEIMKKVFV